MFLRTKINRLIPKKLHLPRRFFKSAPHNLTTLTSTNLHDLYSGIPSFDSILRGSKLLDNHTEKKSTPYNMSHYIKQNNLWRPGLAISPVTLISRPLPKEYKATTGSNPMPNNQTPEAYKHLSAKVHSYIDLLCNLLNNKLAERNYEAGLPDQENVSEREHALQSAKISIALQMNKENVIAMLFHDIARPSHPDVEHGHLHHHIEGSTILAPLKLKTDYTWYHAYAKFLLKKFCPNYSTLLSPVSQHSLLKQEHMFSPQIEKIRSIGSTDKIAEFIYGIMFMRLIDDLSKVPALALEKVEHLENTTIQAMLSKQLFNTMKTQSCANTFENELDAAIKIMSRAEKFCIVARKA